jgi:hypothetical protein
MVRRESGADAESCLLNSGGGVLPAESKTPSMSVPFVKVAVLFKPLTPADDG